MTEVKAERINVGDDTETFHGLVSTIITQAGLGLSDAIETIVEKHGKEPGREGDCHTQALAMTIVGGLFRELSLKYGVPMDVISQVLDDIEQAAKYDRSLNTH